MKQEINFGVPYLKSVDHDTKMGKVQICMVDYCYARDEDDTEFVSPRRCGGYSVDMHLPNTSGEVCNPLYSPTAAKYLLTEWINRAALWSQQVIDVAETSMDARIFTSNQGLEGTFRAEKHEVSTVQEDFRDIHIPSMIHRRSDDCYQSGRLFAAQIKKSEALIESRRKRNPTKVQSKKDEETDMAWKGALRSIRGVLSLWNDKMEHALRVARENGKVRYKDDSRISKFKVLKNHADETDGSFMSETTFNKWLVGKRSTPLDSDWTKVIQSLFDKHVKKK